MASRLESRGARRPKATATSERSASRSEAPLDADGEELLDEQRIGREFLRDHVAQALRRNADILESVHPSEWRSVAFEFVAELREHPLVAKLAADDAADAIERALQELAAEGGLPHQELYPEDLWRAALGDCDSAGNEADPLEDFLHVWAKFRRSTLDVAIERAANPHWQRPDIFGPELVAPRRARQRRFLSVLAELDALHRGEAFPIATTSFADKLGTTRQVVSGWLREARRRHLLDVAALPDPARRRAGEYRWMGPKAESQSATDS